MKARKKIFIVSVVLLFGSVLVQVLLSIRHIDRNSILDYLYYIGLYLVGMSTGMHIEEANRSR